MGGCAGLKCATLKGPFAISCVSKLFEVIERCVCVRADPTVAALYFKSPGETRVRGPEGSARLKIMTPLFPVCCAVNHIVRAGV